MDEDEDEVPTCPLCLEELDATDRAVKACQCGYQVCLWCLHHIREQHSARCPACRTPYEEQNFKFAEVNPELAAREAKERATAKKERERREKLKEVERERARAAAVSRQKAKNNLKHARILQRNLVYVIGLSLSLAREEVIRRAEMFGKFGRMIRILVNRAHPFNADAPGGPSISAYVQYCRDSDASAAVRAMNNAVFDGREIRCAIATTKYCDAFVRSASGTDPPGAQHCGNPHCLYYHTICPPEAVLTREEVLARQLGPPPPAHLFLADPRRHQYQAAPYYRPLQNPLPQTSNVSPPLSAVLGNSALSPQGHAGQPRMPVLPGIASTAIYANMGSSAGPASLMNGMPSAESLTSPRASVLGLATNKVVSAGNTLSSSSLHSPGLRIGSREAGRSNGVYNPGGSPSRSPRKTPPLSPNRKPQSMRMSQPPSRSDPSLGLAIPAGHPAMDRTDLGKVTASAAPFFSPSHGNAQLPSSAGWAISTHDVNRSRSPRRLEPSASLDDISKSRLHPPPRLARDGPPGFEDMPMSHAPAAPSRPPGFDNPNSRPHGKVDVVRSSIPLPVSSSAPPPGFGPSAVAHRENRVEHESVRDVAAAWSQEASADQVFSANERRAKRPVGQPNPRASPEIQNDLGARTELAQVLAKLGGTFGVQSEFKDPTSSGMPARSTPFPVPPPLSDKRSVSLQDTNRLQDSFSSLFGNRTTEGDGSSHSGGLGQAGPDKMPRMSTHPPPFLASSRNNLHYGTPPLTPRRSNSRFDFARGSEGFRSVPNNTEPLSNLKEILPCLGRVKVASVTSNFEVPSKDVGLQTEAHVLDDFSQAVSAQQRTSPAVSPPSRHNRSRFDFADSNPVPTTSYCDSENAMESKMDPAAAGAADATGDAFGATFANLSTAEKLASIFSSAQWSADRLPPMPTHDTQVDQTTGHYSDAKIALQKELKPSGEVSSDTHADTDSSVDRGTSQSVADSHSTQPVPPGFREATPGNSPGTTAVDSLSTSTGVATTVVSDGEGTEAGEIGTVSQVDESLSSGTESVEEDKKKSKSQRKREKKTRQIREALEKRALEFRAAKRTTTISQSAGSPAKPREPRLPVAPPLFEAGGIENTSPGQILANSKESPKPLKLTKSLVDAGRYMSISELEREVEAAREREALLQDKLLDLQRKIRSYDHVRT